MLCIASISSFNSSALAALILSSTPWIGLGAAWCDCFEWWESLLGPSAQVLLKIQPVTSGSLLYFEIYKLAYSIPLSRFRLNSFFEPPLKKKKTTLIPKKPTPITSTENHRPSTDRRRRRDPGPSGRSKGRNSESNDFLEGRLVEGRRVEGGRRRIFWGDFSPSKKGFV